jgi:CDP-diacylglycerol--serine O-phosphatidyltransferase
MALTRYLADGLSLGNLACGVGAIAVAAHGRYDLSLLLMMGGATLDAFDGMAARRFGGSPWGPLSDDIADGVTNGLAPAAVLGFAIGGVEGLVVGGLFAVFTAMRLVLFTLDLGQGDPAWFRGLPSPAGAVIVLSAAVLAPHSPALLGLAAGASAFAMVSFSERWRHGARTLASSRKARWAVASLFLAMLFTGLLTGSMTGPAILMLSASVGYLLQPPVSQLIEAIRKRSLLSSPQGHA